MRLTSRSDDLLNLLGDETVRRVLRQLLARPTTQAVLLRALNKDGAAVVQSGVSRVVRDLKSVGIVELSGSRRSPIVEVVERDAVLSILLAADRLAEALMTRESAMQATRSRETRRLAMRTSESNDVQNEPSVG